MACEMLLCICIPLIISISLIVGMFHLSMLKINIHILVQEIADLLWEDELSGMGTVITYLYHSTVSRIHSIIILDQFITLSKNPKPKKTSQTREDDLILSLIPI